MTYDTASEVKARRPRLADTPLDAVARALASSIAYAEQYCRTTFDRVTPEPIQDAIDVMVEDRIMSQYSRVPDRATAVITDSGSYTLGSANWVQGRPTGLAGVDATLNAYRVPLPQIG